MTIAVQAKRLGWLYQAHKNVDPVWALGSENKAIFYRSSRNVHDRLHDAIFYSEDPTHLAEQVADCESKSCRLVGVYRGKPEVTVGDSRIHVPKDGKLVTTTREFVHPTKGANAPAAQRVTTLPGRGACLDQLQLTAHPTVVVGLPIGFGGVDRVQDGRALVTWETPVHPPDLYRLDLASGAVEPLRDEPRVALASWPKIEVLAQGDYVILRPPGKPRARILWLGDTELLGARVPATGWDPSAFAFAGWGYEVLRPCATRGPHAALPPTSLPRIVINARGGFGKALTEPGEWAARIEMGVTAQTIESSPALKVPAVIEQARPATRGSRFSVVALRTMPEAIKLPLTKIGATWLEVIDGKDGLTFPPSVAAWLNENFPVTQ